MTTANGINFVPQDYVDVTPVWDTKVQMVLHCRRQFLTGPDYPEGTLPEPLEQYSFYRLTRTMDEFYGPACWYQCAESFRWWAAADRFVPYRLLPSSGDRP